MRYMCKCPWKVAKATEIDIDNAREPNPQSQTHKSFFCSFRLSGALSFNVFFGLGPPLKHP